MAHVFSSVLFPSLLCSIHTILFVVFMFSFVPFINFLMSFLCRSLGQNRIHPPPTFGSSSNLEALALQKNKNNIEDGGSAMSVTPYFR